MADGDPPPERLFYGTRVGEVWWQVEIPLDAVRATGAEIADEGAFCDWPFDNARLLERAIPHAVRRTGARPPFLTLVAEDMTGQAARSRSS